MSLWFVFPDVPCQICKMLMSPAITCHMALGLMSPVQEMVMSLCSGA